MEATVMQDIILYIFFTITLLSAICIAITRNLMYAIWGLFLVLFGVAAIFVFAQAEFLAVSQLIVYVGGILILMVFGVMLTQRKITENPRTDLIQVLPALITVLVLGAGFLMMISENDWDLLAKSHATSSDIAALQNIQVIGKQTLTTYLVPFEAISVLLLMAMIGAIFVARKE